MQQNSTIFQELYQKLNPAQKLAVDTIDGPVMVIAGPGTGKTQVLSARVARILEMTDTQPESILALTYTDAGAQNMRERLKKMIGKSAFYVNIHTFHSFCGEVMSEHPEFFTIDKSRPPLMDLEQFELIQKIVDHLPLKILRPINQPHHYIKSISGSIADLKREKISPEKFQQILTEELKDFEEWRAGLKRENKKIIQDKIKLLEKNNELALVYEQYQVQLKELKRHDFEDMIALVDEAFAREPELLSEYQERMQYILVDEYQDTNASQDSILTQLASFWGDNANIFVVGDPNQAIYRFQGASVENMLSFVEKFPEANVIQLETGYRCPQTIYNAAHRVIKQNQLQAQIGEDITNTAEPLQSIQPKNLSIRLLEAPSQIFESVLIAKEIRQLIDDGVPPADIAILYRNNNEASEIAGALSKWDVAYQIEGGGNVIDEPVIIQLTNLLRLINNLRFGNEADLLFSVMLYEWSGLKKIDVLKISRAAGIKKKTIFDLIQADYQAYEKTYADVQLSPIEWQVLSQYISQLTTWATRDPQLTLDVWLSEVMQQAGFLNWVTKQPTKYLLINQVNSLFSYAKSLALTNKNFHIQDFIRALDTLIANNIKIKLHDLNWRRDAVSLATAHKAKGREWQYVYVTGVVDKKWGNKKNSDKIKLPDSIITKSEISKKDKNEDERRLFYVAITRAKKQLTITYPKTEITGANSKEKMVSTFIDEMKDIAGSEVTTLDISENQNEITEDIATLLSSPAKPDVGEQTQLDNDYLASLLKDYKLSATALNNYLRNPREFFIQHILKLPRPKESNMAFGSAVHTALEKMYRPLLTNEPLASLDQTLQFFETALQKEVLTEDEMTRRLQQGREVLQKYYERFAGDHADPLAIERSFGYGQHATVLDDIHLGGKVDRIEWLDRERREVKIIDYKTSRQKTLGDINGTANNAEFSEREQQLPESIKGPLKRQLLFYKLLTELDRTVNFKVIAGEFIFVDADKTSQKHIIRTLDLEQQAVEDLKNLIREVMLEIRTLNFFELL